MIRSDCSEYVHICQAWAFDGGLKHILRCEIYSFKFTAVWRSWTPANEKDECAHWMMVLICRAPLGLTGSQHTENCKNLITKKHLVNKHCMLTLSIQLCIDLCDEINECLWWYNAFVNCDSFCHRACQFIYQCLPVCLVICREILFQLLYEILLYHNGFSTFHISPQLIWNSCVGRVISCTIGGSRAPLSPTGLSKFFFLIADTEGLPWYCT